MLRSHPLPLCVREPTRRGPRVFRSILFVGVGQVQMGLRSDARQGKVELLDPPKDAPIGERVFIEVFLHMCACMRVRTLARRRACVCLRIPVCTCLWRRVYGIGVLRRRDAQRYS